MNEENKFMRWFMFVFFIVLYVFNCITNFFIPLPEVIGEGANVQFEYHYSWHIYLLLVYILIALIQILSLIARHCRGNSIAYRQLTPVMGGIVTIFMGNVLCTLPLFTGIPVDMLSGAINALFLFWALYRRKLFKMTILLSKTNFIIVSMIGNVLNLALNLLGCYVHDMRLQFLEFFGRFYEDGGKAYEPLGLHNTKYVEIIKEEK